MNFAEDFSSNVTKLLTDELDYSEDKKEIIAYSIECIILLVLGLFLIVILGIAFNALMPTLVATLFGVTLRKVSGGAHFDTPLKCLLIGSTIYCIIGVLAKILVNFSFANQQILFFDLLVCLLLVVFLAPVDSISKPIHSSSFKIKLKLLSILFVCVSFLVISFSNNKLANVSIVLGISYQSITLLPIFNRKKGGEKEL